MTTDPSPWLDVLGRRHECGPSLFPYIEVPLMVGGQPATLHLPDYFEDVGRLVIRAVIGDGPLIALIATHP